MTAWKRWIVGLAVGAYGAGAIAQSSLDAPIVQIKPTLRSEIKRGKDASSDCPSDPFDTAARADCLFKVQSANRQKMGTGYEPFDIGLFFSGWVAMHTATLSLGSGMAAEASSAKAQEKITWDLYVKLRKKANLTNEQVVEASGFPPDHIQPMVTQAAESFGN